MDSYRRGKSQRWPVRCSDCTRPANLIDYGSLAPCCRRINKQTTLEGQKLTINYGFDKVRFPSPVPAGSKIRTTGTLKRVEIKGAMIETMNELVVEIEGQEKPCCVAESLGRLVF